MDKIPLVSVVMPVFNSESFIGESITSIIKQSYNNWELIILNDGSTDGSIKVIEGFKDKRIKIFHNEKNKGLAFTRNRLFALASGKYIAILDSDDISLPSRLIKQVTFLENNLDYGMIGSSISFIDFEGRDLNKEMHYPAQPGNIRSILFLHNYFAQSAIMIRSELVNENSYNSEYPPCEDYELWIRIANVSKVWNLPEILIKYRVHDNNISKTNFDKGENSKKKILKEQLELVGLSANDRQLNFYYETLKDNKQFGVSYYEAFKYTLVLIKAVKKNHNGNLSYLPYYICKAFFKAFIKDLIKFIPKTA